MKKLTALLTALTLIVSCVSCIPALAEDAATPSSHILVVYFSATGTTKGVAEKLAEGLNADLYEIVPEQPYTDADLDYNDRSSRTSQETDDPACRPAIAGELPDLTGYDTVFIGYPIWWGDVPRIVSTFVESVDLTDKTMAVFFTSGGSGLGNSMNHLEQQAGAGAWLEGKRFSARTTVDELTDWAASLNIEP
ncbi:MAG: NAD(P)H-dependent oxidoreductase [Clostridia bacterium]|nr:NAD(P)H-dependent oxidoreductase [Clostridia bacterium]